MTDVQHADRALAQRIEQADALNTAAYVDAFERLYSGHTLAAALPVAGGYAVATGPHYPINRALGLGLAGPVDSAELDVVEAFYHQRDLPAEIEVCPLADSGLIERLGARRYSLRRFFSVYARQIAHSLKHPRRAPSVPGFPAGVTVTVLDPGDVDRWGAIVAAVGDMPLESPGHHLARAAFSRPGVTGFAAWIDGDPVAAAGLIIRDGLAGLYAAATHPDVRRRGVHRALIQARLAAAETAGCDLAWVTTVPGADSQRNLERAGFQVMYTRPVLALDMR